MFIVANWTMLLGEKSWISMDKHLEFAAECERWPHHENHSETDIQDWDKTAHGARRGPPHLC